MLKVMLVDDETAVLSGLESLFPWEDRGLCIVAKARNGQEAIEKYKTFNPDIVITDICMNVKDGLSFLMEVKSINANTQVIILTGYPDFEYAKKAVNNGAFAYLLKPISMTELEKVIEKVKAHIYKKNMIVFQQFLYEILNMDKVDKNIVNSLCKKYDISMIDEPYFMITMQIKRDNHDDGYDIYEYANNEITKKLSYQYNIFFCRIHKKGIAILVFCKNSRVRTNICQLIGQIQTDMINELNVQVVLGVSQMFDDLCEINTAWMQSLFAAMQKAVKGYGDIIYYSGKTGGKFDENATSDAIFMNYENTEEVLNGVQNMKKNDVNRIIDEYFEKLQQAAYVEIDRLKDSVSELALQLVHLAAKDDTQAMRIFGRIPHPITEVKKLEMLSQLHEYLKKMTECIFNYSETQISKKYSKHVCETQIYIMQHYSMSVSVEQIADYLHLDSAYLMRIFKKETGQTINNYLTNYRINIAAEIIKSKEYQIQEISSMVGYQDSKYFSKVFKKITGCSPSEYGR